MTRLELLCKNQAVQACNTSELVLRKKENLLALDKCSDRTKFRSSAFNYMLR